MHPQRSTYPLPSTYPSGQPAVPGAPPPPTYPPDVLSLGTASPSPPRRRRARWGTGLVAAVVLIIGAVVGAAALRGSGGANTPRTAVDDWLAAAAAGDVEKARSLTCAAIASHVEQDMSGLAGVTWDIMGADQTDDTATVTIALSRQVAEGRQLITVRWEVVKEGKAWKVCGYGEL